MQTEHFNQVIEAAVDRSLAMMARKNDEYSGNAQYDKEAEKNDDRLRGCKNVAQIRGVNIFSAISGMMAKHTSSIYDLLKNTESGEVPNLSVWQEKITDHINYLLLLEAAVIEQKNLFDLNRCRDEIQVDEPEGQPDDLNAVDFPHGLRGRLIVKN